MIAKLKPSKLVLTTSYLLVDLSIHSIFPPNAQTLIVKRRVVVTSNLGVKFCVHTTLQWYYCHCHPYSGVTITIYVHGVTVTLYIYFEGDDIVFAC